MYKYNSPLTVIAWPCRGLATILCVRTVLGGVPGVCIVATDTATVWCVVTTVVWTADVDGLDGTTADVEGEPEFATVVDVEALRADSALE